MSASRRTSALVVAASVFLSSTTAPVRVAAAQPTEAELAAARSLFEEALWLEDEGRWAEALAKVKKVAAVKTTAAVRFHLALCNEKLGHLVAALDEFGRAEAEAAVEGSPDAKRIESNSQKHAGDLKARIPTVVVRLPAGAEGAEVEIDGARIGAALVGRSIPLDPGSHTIRARADGRLPFEQTIELAEREDERVIDVRLAPRSSDRTEVAAGTSASPWPWVALGVGATSLAGAGVMFGLRASAISELDAACAPSRSQCPDDKSELRDRGRTYNLVGNVLIGVGVAAVGTSIALFVFAPNKPSPSAGSPSGSSSSPVAQGPAAEVVVSGGTLGLRGSF